MTAREFVHDPISVDVAKHVIVFVVGCVVLGCLRGFMVAVNDDRRWAVLTLRVVLTIVVSALVVGVLGIVGVSFLIVIIHWLGI